MFKFPCKSTVECTPYRVTIPPGTYKFELWGAQGGYSRIKNKPELNLESGSKGAYVSGAVKLIGTTELYFYLGGQGENQTHLDGTVSRGGFNGGGNGGVDLCDIKSPTGIPESSSGGGGATDIRLIHGETEKALRSRVIVAGAGAGSTSSDRKEEIHFYLGGNGGKETGTAYSIYAHPGTQTSGIFGRGGNGISYGCTGSGPGYKYGGSTAGSGSGYYGGYVDIEDFSGDFVEIGGAGGSSYVAKYSTNFNDIHNSHLFFVNTTMLSKEDASKFKDPWGKQEPGHFGNGFIKITIIERDGRNIELCTLKPRSIQSFSPLKSLILLLVIS